MTAATAAREPAPAVPQKARPTVTSLGGYAPAAGVPIWGWIVSWDLDGVKVPFTALRDALRDAGLDPTVARDMLPANAFRRAAHTMKEHRIIRFVDQDGPVVRFQFTAEVREQDRLRYDLETILSLDCETGKISGDVPELVARARAGFDEAMASRTTSDVTGVVKRLFADRKDATRDLIPVNKRGTYFVRKEQGEFLDRVETFLAGVGGQTVRIPFAAGTPGGDRQVKETVAQRMEGLIAELDESVAAFGAETTERAMVNAAERVKQVRFKVASYATYLDTEKSRLDAALAGAVGRLRAKIQEVGQLRAAAENGAEA